MLISFAKLFSSSNAFTITIIVFISTVILANIFLNNPEFSNRDEEIIFAKHTHQSERVEELYKNLLGSNNLNIEWNYQYIEAHYGIPEKKKAGKNDYVYRDDSTIYHYFENLSQIQGSTIFGKEDLLRDIGNYGMGLISSILNNNEGALEQFKKVRNDSLKHLHNSMGHVYLELNLLDVSEEHFRKEISLNGFIEGAYNNLFRVLYRKGEINKINELLKDKTIEKYCPLNIKRAIYFKSFRLLKFTGILFKNTFKGINFLSILAAFLIMGSWVMYLRKLDVFEKEKWIHIVATVGLGMVFCFGVFYISEFINTVIGFQLNGQVINDFIYCVFGIGAVEELVKIIPLLLILRFTKVIDEPYHYIQYASLSALGFAFVENIIYFGDHDYFIIHGRALTAVVSHMFDSSIIAYGFILNKYKRKWNPVLNFFLFYGLASLAHGFYDFWLINPAVSDVSYFTFFFLLMSIFIWNSFKNNALNHSLFFDKEKAVDSLKLKDYLLYSLSGILLFEFLVLAFKYGPSVANTSLLSSVYSGTYLIIFLAGNLSKVTLKKDEWEPIKYWDPDEPVHTISTYESYVGKEIKMERFSNNEFAKIYLPNSGTITKRITVSKEDDWYVISLNQSADSSVENYCKDKVVIRTKEKDEFLFDDEGSYVALMLIPNDSDIENPVLSRQDFKFCGWATIG